MNSITDFVALLKQSNTDSFKMVAEKAKHKNEEL